MARNYKARTLLALVTASLGIGGCGVLGSFSKLEGMEEEVAARVAATMTAQAHYSGEPTYAPPTPTPTSEPPALSPTEQSAPQEQYRFLDLAGLQEAAITLGYTDRPPADWNCSQWTDCETFYSDAMGLWATASLGNFQNGSDRLLLVRVEGRNHYMSDVRDLARASGVPDYAIDFGLNLLTLRGPEDCLRRMSLRQTPGDDPRIEEGFEIAVGNVEWLREEGACAGPRYIEWVKIPSPTTAAEPTPFTPPTRINHPTPTRVAQPTSQPARSGRSVLDMTIEEALSELSQWDLREESPELYARIFCLDEGPCDWSLENMEGFSGIITNETTGEELKDYMVVTLLVDGYDVYGANVMMITDAGETSKSTPIPRGWEILGQDWIDALGLPRDVTDQMSEYLGAALNGYGRPETFKDYADIGDLEIGMFVGNALELYVADCTAAWCERDH